MAALTKNRDCQLVLEGWNNDPVAASTQIYRGAGVCLDSLGNAVNASATTGLVTRGVARDHIDNSTGIAGAKRIETEEGLHRFVNSSGDAITAAQIGDLAYWEDNQTVCKTGTGKSPVGPIESISADGFVVVDVQDYTLVFTGLTAANNLSDVGTAATARANIGANKMTLTGEKVSSKGSDAEIYRFVIPFACTLVKAKTVLNAALATADATVQFKKNGSNIGSTTTGLITQTQSGSAAGDVDSCTPLTTNVTLAEDDVVTAVVAGGSTATATFNITLSLTY